VTDPIRFIDNFADLPDPRVERTWLHSLMDILVVTLCAVIVGAEGWSDIAQYGVTKQQWLKTFLELPHGIPTDDTFRRVFARLDPAAFRDCFAQWPSAIQTKTRGQVILFDGERLPFRW
jgi:hypothetical protein